MVSCIPEQVLFLTRHKNKLHSFIFHAHKLKHTNHLFQQFPVIQLFKHLEVINVVNSIYSKTSFHVICTLLHTLRVTVLDQEPLRRCTLCQYDHKLPTDIEY